MLRVLKSIDRLVDYRLKRRVKTIGYNVSGLGFILKEMEFAKMDNMNLKQLKI